MKRTLIRNEMRKSLMDNTMRIVVEEGFSNLTTKKMAQASGLAEIYIYRYFESKTALLEQCFMESEILLGERIKELFTRIPEKELEEHAKDTWYEFWDYLMENKNMIVFCTRFYNSSYFTEEILEFTRHEFQKIRNEISNSGKGWSVSEIEQAEKDMMVKYIVNVTVDYAVKVMHGEMDNSEETIHFVYQRIIPPVLNEMKIEYLK